MKVYVTFEVQGVSCEDCQEWAREVSRKATVRGLCKVDVHDVTDDSEPEPKRVSRLREGALSPLSTPTNPPATQKLVPLDG